MMRSEWPVGDVSDLEAMNSMVYMPETRLSVDGYPDQRG